MPARANPNVSNVILKALSNGTTRTQNVISAKEFTEIKKSALAEVKASATPTAAARSIQSSFDLGDRATAGRYAEKFSELKATVKSVAEQRAQSLRQVDTNDWTGGGRTGTSTGRTTRPVTTPVRTTGTSTGRSTRTTTTPTRTTGTSTGRSTRTTPTTPARTTGTSTGGRPVTRRVRRGNPT